MTEIIQVPYYKLSPDKIVLYSKMENYIRSEKEKSGYVNLRNNENIFNEISEAGQRRLKEKIELLIYTTKNRKIKGYEKTEKIIIDEIEIKAGKMNKNSINYKLGMITLTLASIQHNTDEEIKKNLLNNFLQICRTKWKIENYIWKAEKQDNGNIHFHIIIDKFVSHTEIRESWNRIQNKKDYEYIDNYRKKMKLKYVNGFIPEFESCCEVEKQKERYDRNILENWSNPNSTDIHSLKNIRNAAAYISKYLAKGVTGSNRKLEMLDILRKTKPTEKYIEKLKNSVLPNISEKRILEKINRKLIKYTELLELLKTEFEILKSKGISGRIYGTSESLSKLSALKEVENYRDIPDIEIIERIKRHESIFEIGKSKIITKHFDIRKTPNLNQLLKKHIENCQTNT